MNGGGNMKNEAISNLRNAWGFYQMCKKGPDAGATGARQDAKEWLEEAIKEVLRRYK